MHALSSGEVYAFVPNYLQAEHCPSKDANDEGHGGNYFAKSCRRNGSSEYEAKTVGICFTETVAVNIIAYGREGLYIWHSIYILIIISKYPLLRQERRKFHNIQFACRHSYPYSAANLHQRLATGA